MRDQSDCHKETYDGCKSVADKGKRKTCVRKNQSCHTDIDETLNANQCGYAAADNASSRIFRF